MPDKLDLVGGRKAASVGVLCTLRTIHPKEKVRWHFPCGFMGSVMICIQYTIQILIPLIIICGSIFP